jgi:hypothetical protein
MAGGEKERRKESEAIRTAGKMARLREEEGEAVTRWLVWLCVARAKAEECAKCMHRGQE